MQKHADKIKEFGILAEEAYTTYPDKYPLSGKGLQNSYTVIASTTQPSGFQGMLLKNTETSNYVFAFRGTEADPFFTIENFKDLIITDFAYMGSGRAPQQMKDAMSFVEEMRDKFPDVKSSKVTFTGHSLGGSIAGMASYIYGFECYTYNGFGIKNMLWDANDTYQNKFSGEWDYTGLEELEVEKTDLYHSLGEHLQDLGVEEIKKSTNKITNIVQIGYDRSDIVGGIATDIVSGQEGETHFVLNHTGDEGGTIANHKIKPLNQSISIYGLGGRS